MSADSKNATPPAALVQRLLAGREQWLDLPGVADGRQVRVRRPPEAQMPAVLLHGELDDFLACVVGWRRWTEAHILGASQASDVEAAFDAELWRTLALDNVKWCTAVAEKVKAMCADFMKQRGAAEGN